MGPQSSLLKLITVSSRSNVSMVGCKLEELGIVNIFITM